jgi:hypothetical protein
MLMRLIAGTIPALSSASTCVYATLFFENDIFAFRSVLAGPTAHWGKMAEKVLVTGGFGLMIAPRGVTRLRAGPVEVI